MRSSLAAASQRSVEPSLEGVGLAPPSQLGSLPSSHEKVPSSSTGALPSSQAGSVELAQPPPVSKLQPESDALSQLVSPAPEAESPPETAGQRSLEPLLEGVGLAPPSQLGSLPSAHEKVPSGARTGALESSQLAGSLRAAAGGFAAVFLFLAACLAA